MFSNAYLKEIDFAKIWEMRRCENSFAQNNLKDGCCRVLKLKWLKYSLGGENCIFFYWHAKMNFTVNTCDNQWRPAFDLWSSSAEEKLHFSQWVFCYKYKWFVIGSIFENFLTLFLTDFVIFLGFELTLRFEKNYL